MNATLSLSCAAVLCLGACASVPPAPDLAAESGAPAGWAAGGPEAAPAGDWLDAFGDPALTALVTEAMEHNTDLRAAAARLDQARASAVSAGAARLPSVDASGGATARNATTVAFDPSTGGAIPGGGARTTTDSYSLGANVSWEADVWGRVAATAQAAEAEALASEADLYAARLSVAGAVSQAWFSLIAAELQAELSARDVASRENSLDFIERRYRSGVNTSLDVRLARSALASARGTLQTRLQARAETARQLETLLGRYPAAELEAVRYGLPEVAPLSGAGDPADLLWRRPDLAAAELRLESAGLRAEAARDALLPRLTLRASANANTQTFTDLFDVDNLVGTLAGNLAQPIFQGGALRAEVDRSEAAAEGALVSYVSAALTAWREAENALAAESRLAERVELARIAFEEAARAEELAERQYTQGLQNIFNLLDAQSRRISNESQYIAVRQERAANRVRLYLAIGGDFDVPAGPFAGAAAQEPAL